MKIFMSKIKMSKKIRHYDIDGDLVCIFRSRYNIDFIIKNDKFVIQMINENFVYNIINIGYRR